MAAAMLRLFASLSMAAAVLRLSCRSGLSLASWSLLMLGPVAPGARANRTPVCPLLLCVVCVVCVLLCVSSFGCVPLRHCSVACTDGLLLPSRLPSAPYTHLLGPHTPCLALPCTALCAPVSVCTLSRAWNASPRETTWTERRSSSARAALRESARRGAPPRTAGREGDGRVCVRTWLAMDGRVYCSSE